ncbi:hypothetical protein [Dokdonia sp. 4H-3-7-5]|uniref:hypothetical protein n=1 Tax=Dokdonia sp. (strain 4H-3-7-5) TaxID=983548 RepID=UPI00020A6B91|nr:hypothetical protein [Dokdonia sp. 4H-3-7-5]AEE18516.1 hypothetical protein Krodi_0531 [Dokdonia sp. 4H-3-7-5]
MRIFVKGSIIVLLSMMISCASYTPRMINKARHKIDAASISSLNGTYDMDILQRYNRKGYAQEPYESGYYKAFRQLDVDDKEYDSLSNYAITLKLVNNKTLKAILLKEGNPVDTTEIVGRLKGNGLFHFKGENLECTGIPYILGGCTASKTRIGLTKDGHLLVNYAYSSEGALLLIFGAGMTYNTVHSFSRIK